MANAFKCDYDILTSNDSGIATTTRFMIYVHTFEGQDLSAKRMAEYQLSPAAGGSYHIVIDWEGVTARENDDEYIPWAAMDTGNITGWHISLGGKAAFTRAQWLARPKQLARLAEVIAAYAEHKGIPLIKRDHIELRARKWGVAGHADISKAWNESDHTDPGVNFPFDVVIAEANKILTSGKTPASQPEKEQPTVITPGHKYPSYIDGRELRFSEYIRHVDAKVTRVFDELFPDGGPDFAVALDAESVGEKYPSYADNSKSFTLDQYVRLIDYKVDHIRKAIA